MRKLIAIFLVTLAVLPAADARRRRRRRSRIGFLKLNSTTTGAEVFVDGKKIGEIPLERRVPLRAGKHTLKLIRPGYTQYLDVFKIHRRRTTSLDIDLLPMAGVFIVSSKVSDARVYIDGKFVGTTPVEHESLIGKRTIRVRKAGYYDFVVTRNAIAGQTQTIRADLKALPVGTTPYRPAPPPPPEWYEKWYVWAAVAGGVAAVAATVSVAVSKGSKDEIADFNATYKWKGALYLAPGGRLGF